ncbi:MAG TPA: phosphotransferase [Candidatus Bathyarchaeia archaeon]|nr:phosphotransferase [Candidatus Bathyarchaeia archaeon]
MTENAYRWTERHFTDFFTTKTSASIIPSLIHGYFGTSNILYDISSHRITGIIDFGSAKIGEPAVDYAALLASNGDDFIQLVENHNPNIRSMMERVLFYMGTFAIQEALFGLEHDDPIAF